MVEIFYRLKQEVSALEEARRKVSAKLEPEELTTREYKAREESAVEINKNIAEIIAELEKQFDLLAQ